MNPLLRHSAAHVFVDSLIAPTLCDDDDHHLRRVLRLRSGSTVSLSDGAGKWVSGMLTDTAVQTLGEIHECEPPPPTTIVCAIPKGDRPELIVQKLTEIGLSQLCFVGFERSVVRWDDDRVVRQKLLRLNKIAREAAMQSRRAWLLNLQILDTVSLIHQTDMCVAEPGGAELSPTCRAIVVGPEGGLTPAELGLFTTAVGLGGTILRVETAAIVAGTLLIHTNG